MREMKYIEMKNMRINVHIDSTAKTFYRRYLSFCNGINTIIKLP